MVKEGIVDVSESMGAMLFGVLMTIIAISTPSASLEQKQKLQHREQSLQPKL